MLPRLVEYLLSIRRPGAGRPLVTQSGVQAIIPIFPANTQVASENVPPNFEYMDIIYQVTLDPQMNPGAFSAVCTYVGGRPINGVATQWFMQNDLYTFVVITKSNPGQSILENITPLNQYYAANFWYLSIASKEDAEDVYKYLESLVADKGKYPNLWKPANALAEDMRRAMDND